MNTVDTVETLRVVILCGAALLTGFGFGVIVAARPSLVLGKRPDRRRTLMQWGSGHSFMSSERATSRGFNEKLSRGGL